MSRLLSRTLLTSLLALSTFASVALAEPTASSLERALSELPDGGVRFLQRSGSGTEGGGASLVAKVKSRAEAEELGLIPITSQIAVGTRSLSSWDEIASRAPAFFSPERGLFLDLAGETVGLAEARDGFGLDGDGTVVGIVDTGLDVALPAFRKADGSTRVRWMLAFGQEPRGVHPELEEEFGCGGEDSCAVYDSADLDAVLGSNILASLPKDRIGHGTHITSLAAGDDELYPGIASGADLIVVAGASESGGVSDTRILLGAKFVFERAQELQMPAVVNVSLGSSFGAHDGQSPVELGLAQLASGPGRALVVASGNSGEVVEDLSEVHAAAAGTYPGPFGVHTEVSVPEGAHVRVPILTLPTDDLLAEGSVFVWISMYEDAELALGFSSGEGAESAFQYPGDAGGLTSASLGDSDVYDVVILNGDDRDLGFGVEEGSAVVGVAGSWHRGKTFEIVLKGKGTARLWVTGTGSVGTAQGLGPLLPRARHAGTVSVPGSDPNLITVGATINRNSWTDITGSEVGFPPSDGGLAPFSSAGPNQLGQLKPEIVAPGVGVIGAMSGASDPRKGTSPFSQFAGACARGDECLVIDDLHGVATGTSMAAPIVAGAVSLLMQREPDLTMERAKQYLMAGSTPLVRDTLGSRHGAGELDVVGALQAQERSLFNDMNGATTARVVWADDFVHPSPGASLEGYVLFRDEENIAASTGGLVDIEVTGPGEGQWEFLGAGIGRIRLHADAGSNGSTLGVKLVRGADVLVSSEVPVGSDPIVAEHGSELTGAACGVDLSAPYRQHSSPVGAGLVLLLMWGGARRRRASAS